MSDAFLSGLILGLQLILAIGAQNAFVLRQGLRREHVFAVCLTCGASDAALVAVGIVSFAAVQERFPSIAPAFLLAGSAFLIWYGANHIRSALAGSDVLVPGNGTRVGLRSALLTCLALTWFNPHVYLDTVILLGSLSMQFPDARFAFGSGAVAASFLFFFSLGYGARLLTPLFASPKAWQILDCLVGLTMWAIAAKLLFEGLG
jgi:L-lysine exporter family protein LysE/ArgO